MKQDVIQPWVGTDVTTDEFDRWLDDVRERLSIEAWREIGTSGNPVFLNSWVNTGGAYAPASFYKDPFNRVYMTGRISTGISNTTAFYLPEGYRPPYEMAFTVQSNAGGPGPGGTSYIKIQTDGAVVPVNAISTTGMSLETVGFRV